jgi:prephenate dehydrogenase
VLQQAGVADVVTADASQIVGDADIVVLAAPIDACVAMLERKMSERTICALSGSSTAQRETLGTRFFLCLG